MQSGNDHVIVMLRYYVNIVCTKFYHEKRHQANYKTIKVKLDLVKSLPPPPPSLMHITHTERVNTRRRFIYKP